MKPKMLHAGTDRDEAHVELEKILASGKYAAAECREDPNSEEPYQVWSGPDVKPDAPPAEPASELGDDALDLLADKLLERMEKRAG